MGGHSIKVVTERNRKAKAEAKAEAKAARKLARREVKYGLDQTSPTR